MDEEDPPNLKQSDLELAIPSEYFDLFGEVPDIGLPHEFLSKPPDASSVTITNSIFEDLSPIAFYKGQDSFSKETTRNAYEEPKKDYKNRFSLAT